MSGRLVDIGANLTNKAFRADCDAVLARAAAAGVGCILITGTNVEASRRAREMAVEARALGRGEPNERPIARVVAGHRGETLDDLAGHTTQAARALFAIAPR